MKFKLRYIFYALGVLVLLAVGGFVFWAETPLGPAPEALTALQSDSQVTVTVDRFVTFEPANSRPSVGFIF